MASAKLSVISSPLLLLLLVLSVLPEVRGESSSDQSLTGLVVASCVAFVLFIIIIVVLVMSLSWKRWYPFIQRSRGKVKMPMSYWKKKQEAKDRLLMNTSRASRMTASTTVPQENRGMNGNAAHLNRAKDTASWIHGWHNTSSPDDKTYEDVSLTMELGEEKEEPEFRIETSVVDDETLDLEPFKSSDEDATYTAVLPRPRPQQPPTASEAAAATDGVATTSDQTVSMQMADEEDEETEPKRKSFYNTPLMDRPRQVTSSDTPAPPLPPPPAEESFAQFLDSSQVAF